MKKIFLCMMLATAILTGCGSENKDNRKDTAIIDSGTIDTTNIADTTAITHTTDSTVSDNSGNGGSKL